MVLQDISRAIDKCECSLQVKYLPYHILTSVVKVIYFMLPILVAVSSSAISTVANHWERKQ